jgi:hypothetical protein
VLDETLLEDPAGLRRRDRDTALLSLAVAGARVRTASRLAAESGIGRLTPEGRPRHIVLVGQASAALAGDLLAALVGNTCPVTVLRPTGLGEPESSTAPVPGARWTLPGWIGPMDLLVLLSSSPTEDGLSTLARQGYRRGPSIAVIARPNSPLASLAEELHAPLLPYAPPGPTETAARPTETPGPEAPTEEAPGTFWGLLPALLLLADRLRLADADPDTLAAVADRLDETAGRCGPESPIHRNPAKALAIRLADSLPLLWSDSPAATAVAARFAATLAARSGIPSLAAALPEALWAHRGLLEGTLTAGQDVEDSFFRDRVDDPEPLRPHVVLLRTEPPGTAIPDDGRIQSRPLDLARRLTETHQVTLSEPTPLTEPDPEAPPQLPPPAPESSAAAFTLPALAELIAQLDFTAVYLGLAASRT